MKNTFLTSRLSLLSIAFLAVSSYGWGQQKAQPAGARDESALVQTVREATKQYLDVNNAIARWIWAISRLCQWLRPWRHGHPLRQFQLAERND